MDFKSKTLAKLSFKMKFTFIYIYIYIYYKLVLFLIDLRLPTHILRYDIYILSVKLDINK